MKAIEEEGDFPELQFLDDTQLGHFGWIVAMVRQGVGAAIDPIDVLRKRSHMDAQRNNAGGIRTQGQLHYIENIAMLLDPVVSRRNVFGHRRIDLRFWLSLPFLGRYESLLQLAHRSEILIQLHSIRRANLAVQALNPSDQRIQNAAFLFQAPDLRFDFRLVALQEHSLKQASGLRFSRNRDARRGKGHGLAAFGTAIAGSDHDGQEGKARLVANRFRR